MKDAKFIELLNLYVDQQIDAADAARLEEEITRNPVRRRTYQQYCRMHKACSVLFEQSRPEQAVGEKLAATAEAADEKVVAFPAVPSRTARNVVYWGGLAAAAACVALFVTTRQDPTPAETMLASTPPANAPEQIVHITPVPTSVAKTPSPERQRYQPVFVTRTMRLSDTDASTAAPNAPRTSLEWVNNLQLSPVHIPAEQLFIDSRPTLKSDISVIRSGRPTHWTAERAAYEFQR